MQYLNVITMHFYSQIIINSVVTGSIYVLMAIGLTIIYKVLKFANFSHAELVTFGHTWLIS